MTFDGAILPSTGMAIVDGDIKESFHKKREALRGASLWVAQWVFTCLRASDPGTTSPAEAFTTSAVGCFEGPWGAHKGMHRTEKWQTNGHFKEACVTVIS